VTVLHEPRFEQQRVFFLVAEFLNQKIEGRGGSAGVQGILDRLEQIVGHNAAIIARSGGINPARPPAGIAPILPAAWD